MVKSYKSLKMASFRKSGGRPPHNYWGIGGFRRVKLLRSGKTVAVCTVCNQHLTNTALLRLKTHRNICPIDKINSDNEAENNELTESREENQANKEYLQKIYESDSNTEEMDHSEYCSLDCDSNEVINDKEIIGEDMDNVNDEKEIIYDDPDNVKNSHELLIEYVKRYPYLYDHENKHFKNISMRENAWEEIAAALKMTSVECQTRWTRLRDRYGREKRWKEEDAKHGRIVRRRSEFALYDNMSFLNKHVKKRFKYRKPTITSNKSFESKKRNGSTVLIVDPEEEQSPPDMSAFEEYEGEDIFSGTQSSVDVSNVISTPIHLAPSTEIEDSYSDTKNYSERKKVKLENTLQSIEGFCNLMHHKISTESSSTTQQSNEDILAKLIARELEALPPEERKLKKKKIFEILYE